MNLFRKFILISLIFLIIGSYSCNNQEQFSLKSRIGFLFGKTYNYNDILVKRVIDGDTLQLENGQRVRLIGIDTPEIHLSDKLYKDIQRTKKDILTIRQLGMKAYEFTRNLVENKRVRLEFDVEKYDKYGRLLAYVYLKDGTFVNAEILRQGYATLMTVPPNVKYSEFFLRLYQEARQNQRGLWR